LRKVLYIFGLLTDADIDWMARVGIRRRLKDGEILIEEGKPIDSIILLLEGQLSVAVRDVGPVARLGVGEITGGTTGVLAGSVMLTVGLLTGQGDGPLMASNDEILGSKLVAIGGGVLLTAAAAVVIDGVRRLWNHGGARSRVGVAPAGAGFVVSGEF